jgi:DNA-directed RNA polymerase specialized sigma24 family protein
MGLLFDSDDRPAASEPDRVRDKIGPALADPPAADFGGGLPGRVWDTLQPLLSVLPERERVAMLLRFRDAVPQSCIAATMGIHPALVERLLGTALARLRDQM